MHRTLVSLIITGAAIASPYAAGAQSTWFPMQIGNEWSYVGSGGANEVLTIIRSTTFGGREVFVLAYGPSPQNAGLENYWSAAADGDVLVSGFFRSVDGFGYLYDPPVPLVDIPLAIGKRWTQSSHIFQLPEMTDLGLFNFSFEVFTEGLVSVPAGVYYAFGIGLRGPPAALEHAELDVTGMRRSAGTLATDWWTDGLGRAQYQSDDFYRLGSFNFPTPTRATTWGTVKALYR